MGRPSDYNLEVAQAICARMAAGETLLQICRDPAMPARSTAYLWTIVHPEFSDMYARARKALYEHWADELVDIAEDGRNDWVERERKDGSKEMVCDREHIQRSTLRVDTRKWMLAKLQPKQYGDKLALGGAEDLAPFTVTLTAIDERG